MVKLFLHSDTSILAYSSATVFSSVSFDHFTSPPVMFFGLFDRSPRVTPILTIPPEGVSRFLLRGATMRLLIPFFPKRFSPSHPSDYVAFFRYLFLPKNKSHPELLDGWKKLTLHGLPW